MRKKMSIYRLWFWFKFQILSLI